MAYIASTFIGTYSSTGKTLKIINAEGRSFTINVCNYNNAFVQGSEIRLVMEDAVKERILDFSSPAEAKMALALFNTAYTTLRPNCNAPVISGGGPTGSPAPISITYAAYKAAVAASNLVALQYYDVIDTTGAVMPTGTIMRVVPLSINDYHPRGIVLGNKANIAINTNTDKILFYEQPGQKITIINSDFPTIDSSSTNVTIKSGGVNIYNSNYIDVEDSFLSASNCNHVSALNGSSVDVYNATHVIFDNISQDMTALPFPLSHVKIDRNTTLGKSGRMYIPGPTEMTLQAYYHEMEIELIHDIALNGNDLEYIFTLENKFPQAGAEFRFKHTGTLDIPVYIRNADTTPLYTMTEANKDTWVVFSYNKLTQAFELISDDPIKAIPVTYKPTVSDNQVTFTLPKEPKYPNLLEMYVNGSKQLITLDFVYDTTLGINLIYQNRHFTLSATDEVEIIIN